MIEKLREMILELLYPTRARCLGCGDEEGCDEPFLCEECRKLLKASDVLTSHREWKEHGLEAAAFVYYYGRPIRGLIRAYKFQGVWMLAENMAQDMERLLRRRMPLEFDMIVPVPLHPARQRDRGYNQAEMLARPLAESCGVELRTDVLSRVRKTKQQSKLKRSSRAGNTHSAFCAKNDLTGKRILLVDDVVTTGSTLCACSDALKAAGAKEIHAIALAGSRMCGKYRSVRYRRKK